MKWIKTSEQLPEAQKLVLCYWKENSGCFEIASYQSATNWSNTCCCCDGIYDNPDYWIDLKNIPIAIPKDDH